MSQKVKILGREAKHITYVKAQDGSDHDALVVKEVLHLDDGRKVPNLKIWEDYQRPWYATLPGHQKHKDKKDYELVSKCRKYKSKQITLARDIVKVLKDYSFGPNPPLKKAARNPYLYGVDVTSSCLLKSEYRSRWSEYVTPNRVAAGDIETNVHTKDQEIIMMSVTCKEKVKLVYVKSWLGDIENPVEKTHELAEHYIGDVLKERNIQLEVELADTPAKLVISVLNTLHEWKPDFFTFWNINFDIPRMVAALEKEGYNPADHFSDPSVPDNYKYFYYRPGPSQKETASGKVMSINIEDRWNWATHPAAWQVIDSMPVYRNLRIAAGKEPSYKLDYILQREKVKIKKLRFKETEHLKELTWHEVMQRDYKIEYGIYNIVDCIALEMLDEKTNDLASSISIFSANSDYKNFNSNPKRLCDALHFWYLEKTPAMVIGSSPDTFDDPLDKFVVDHAGWVVTLPSYMTLPKGIACVKEFPNYNTLIFTHVADLDLVSAYPNASQLLNIGRETCVMEFSRMKGISDTRRREVGINLTGAATNAVEIVQKILKAPTFDEVLLKFCNANNLPCDVLPHDDAYVRRRLRQKELEVEEVVIDDEILEDN